MRLYSVRNNAYLEPSTGLNFVRVFIDLFAGQLVSSNLGRDDNDNDFNGRNYQLYCERNTMSREKLPRNDFTFAKPMTAVHPTAHKLKPTHNTRCVHYNVGSCML